MALEIKYNGKTIATLEKGQTATIPCDGKKMATDLVVSISNSGGNNEIDTSGLYDADNNLLASWDTLTTVYGMDVEKEYTGSTYETDTASPCYILANNSEFSNATKIVIPEGVTNFGNYAFRKCSNLTTVTIPNSVTAIGNFAFADCTGLTDIVLPNSVTTIGSGAFARCSNLTVFVIPEGVTVIDGRVFSDCSSLSSISIPNSVSSIGASAFYRCYGLTTVKLPDGIVNIGITAFQECSNLASIIIPDSISSIELSAFTKCTSLSDVYYKGNEKQWNAIDIGTGNEPLTNATIHYNYGKLDLISFTIAGKTYQAEQGMTWVEWVDSSYNTDGFSVEKGHFVLSSNGWRVIDEEGVLEYPTDAISNGGEYTLTDPTN